MLKIEEIKFGMLSENEMYWLRQALDKEVRKRQTKPDEYIKVIRADDEAEGFYVKLDDFHKIKSDQLHRYIAQTLSYGSTITFSVDEYEKKDYEENGKRYEWAFDDDEDQEELSDEEKRVQ